MSSFLDVIKSENDVDSQPIDVKDNQNVDNQFTVVKGSACFASSSFFTLLALQVLDTIKEKFYEIMKHIALIEQLRKEIHK